MVDNSENGLAEALARATDGLIAQDEADEQIEPLVAVATEV